MIALLLLWQNPDLDAVRRAFEEGRDEDVLRLSEPIISKAPGDLHFMRGASQRRLARPQEALDEFDAAEAAGFAFSELHLERARAFMDLGRWTEAERELDRADDPELGDLVELERAKVDIELGEQERARGRLEKLTEGRYGAPAAEMLDTLAKRDSIFDLDVKPLWGFDTNLLGLASDVALSGERKRESLYVGGDATARLWLARPDPWGAEVESQSRLKYYFASSDSSYFEETLSLSGGGPVNDDVAVGAKLSYGESATLGDGHFRRILGAAAGARVRPVMGWEIDLTGSIADLRFFTDVPAPQDRDGVTRQAGMTHSIDLGDGWKLAPTAGWFDYRAQGSDFDHQGWQFGASLTSPEMAGFTLTLSANYSRSLYDGANSLSTAGSERRDDAYAYSLTIARRFEGFDWTPSVTLTFNDARSNVGAYDYDRFDVQVGLGLQTWF